MAGEWRKGTLGDFVALQRGHDLTDSERRPGHVPVMGSAGQNGFHDTSLTPGPGVVVGRSGASFGKVHFCAETYWPHNTVLYVTDFKGNDPRFAYFFLGAIDFTRYNSGSAQPSLNRNYIYSIPVSFPEPKEQQAIACILGALDDKIELNRRMNRTLEGLARALFQSWFVDFDPVRAKSAGRTPPGLPPSVAALFPATLENSDIGEIPRGWRVAAIKERASRIQYGLTESASANPIGPRFLRITDIRGGKVDWSAVPYCQVSDSDLEKYGVHDGDVFVARTGASTGENTYIVEPPLAVFASYLVRFQFEERGIARVVGEFMRSESYFSFVKGSIGGSAQPNANAQTLGSAQMVFPSAGIAARFYELIRPLDEKRALNARQAESLAALRDALLPKLISGKLRVPDAERVVERTL